MSTPEDFTAHKQHRDSKSGRKADKKKDKKSKVLQGDPKQRNPKAFAFNSAVRAERRFRRKQDVDTKKQHIPLVDRTPVEPPPIVVAVVGPPKVGKTLLIQCLVKKFTKQPLSSIVGPVTVVAAKRRRITFIECNNDINSMIDIAKVADLALLMIDGYSKFEMETFEFLNICQVHGMPRIMGVLNHLDLFKNMKQMKKVKRELKHRFWTETYQGAKLFYLSGLLHDEYLRNEIKNLTRFISCVKFRPLTWRSTHPYLLVDRVEDLTDPELIRQNSKVDRSVSLYGYVRGVPFHNQSSIHIPGCGDLKIKDISYLPDPCPLPEHLKKRALIERERLVYAPFSGVSGIVYDKDAVYIELGGSHHHTKEDGGLVSQLLQTQETLDHKLEKSELQLFSDFAPLKAEDVQQIFTQQIDSDNSKKRKVDFDESDEKINGSDKAKEKMIVDDGDGDDDSDEDDDESGEENDSDDEDESDEEDEDEESNNEANQSKKRKTVQKSSGKKKMKTDSSASVASEENLQVYHKPRINKDEHVKNKISEVFDILDRVNSKKSKSNKKSNKDSDDESFDELSDDEAFDFKTKLEKDEFGDDDNDDSDDDDNEDQKEEDDDDSEEEDDSPDNLKWKKNIAERAREAFMSRQQTNVNLQSLVYGVFDKNRLAKEKNEEKEEEKEEGEELGGIFRVVQEKQKQKIAEKELQNQEECVFYSKEPPRDWLQEGNKDLLINRFVTGKWKDSEDAETLLKLDDLDDEEVFDDFEDLETGKKFTAEDQAKKGEKSEEAEKEAGEETDDRKKLLEKKKKLKAQFDTEYDTTDRTYYDDLKDECQRQADLNKSEFEGLDDSIRVTLEGFRPGMYVRLEIDDVPCELVTNLDPNYPMIVGGLLPGEENVGYVQTRIKKHRWYPKILKSKDPIIMSVGWRRFQTIMIFSQFEDNFRSRMLKYTPEHVTCMGHFWGPVTPQGTGILAVQDVSRVERDFRVIATGTVVEMDKSSKIMKKLKLTGVPYKIFKKTAFVKDMFNSNLEVAKFEGAKIKTVSGIRGIIKKPVFDIKMDGCFRATFEDKIKMSDIVFCRTWYRVEIPRFYNPVTSLLLPAERKGQWTGMRTTGQLKRELDVHAEPNPDSLYTAVQRRPKLFKPLRIPKTLQKELPYVDKPKVAVSLGKKRRFDKKRVAVVRDQKEEGVARLMRMIRTNFASKEKKNKEAMHQRIEALKRRQEDEEAKKIARQRKMKKEIFSELTRMGKKA